MNEQQVSLTPRTDKAQTSEDARELSAKLELELGASHHLLTTMQDKIKELEKDAYTISMACLHLPGGNDAVTGNRANHLAGVIQTTRGKVIGMHELLRRTQTTLKKLFDVVAPVVALLPKEKRGDVRSQMHLAQSRITESELRNKSVKPL